MPYLHVHPKPTPKYHIVAGQRIRVQLIAQLEPSLPSTELEREHEAC